MADTGNHTGCPLFTRMGLNNRRHLLPVNMKMTEANRGAIGIGALFRISGTSHLRLNLQPIKWYISQPPFTGCYSDNPLPLLPHEPVLVDTPVTWCHKIIICQKRSSKPRCNVDLQLLNRHAT
ncbi:hypothetical protein PoB_004109600 [Plakobranchus ocellatus]|uniref:Uncharacterized protein n=1 Tax=Plakobranchus ocellatus TaxID=259542 RepID=A0AAV4AU46_9GAST|nr:hypothetical protein PoB_004109600 [Plakobranchus ocellatus]